MRNVLVQYQGGGYDGCYWEWNFFYFDKDGVFYDIGSSGRAGCDTEEKARQLLARDESSTYIYDLTQESVWAEISKENHPGNALMLLRWFEEQNFENVEPKGICSECGESIWADDLLYNPEYGPNDLICLECWSIGQCLNCSYYVGTDNIQKYEDEWLCADCIEYREEDKQQKQQQDLLYSALATGMPDLFGNEMRWYWN